MMKISILTLTIVGYFMLYACKLKTKLPRVTIPQVGTIYQSKRFGYLTKEDRYLEITRFAKAKFPKDVDSSLIQFGSLGPKDRNPRKTTYFLSADAGEQWQLFLDDSANLWLNATSQCELYYLDGKPAKELTLFDGEAYIETKDSLVINLNDSTKLFCKAGSNINIRNYRNEQSISIALEKGFFDLTLNGKSKFAIVTSVKPTESIFTRALKCERVEECDFKRKIAWKEAGWFHFDNATLPFLMQSFDRWYKTKTYYNGRLPVDSFNLTFAYSLPLDSALAAIAQLVPFKYEKYDNAILVFP